MIKYNDNLNELDCIFDIFDKLVSDILKNIIMTDLDTNYNLALLNNSLEIGIEQGYTAINCYIFHQAEAIIPGNL